MGDFQEGTTWWTPLGTNASMVHLNLPEVSLWARVQGPWHVPRLLATQASIWDLLSGALLLCVLLSLVLSFGSAHVNGTLLAPLGPE